MAQDGKREDNGKRDKIRWVLGWVVVPGSILSVLFLFGVHIGARNPEMWLSKLAVWLFG